MKASQESIKWSGQLAEADDDNTADVLSPVEVFQEAFGELDQLDAAMLQLAPRKKYSFRHQNIFIPHKNISILTTVLSQLRDTPPSVTAGCLSPP